MILVLKSYCRSLSSSSSSSSAFLEIFKTAPGLLPIFRFLVSPLNITMSDEEPVDQKKILEDRSKGKCVKQLRKYEACVDRIKGDETGTKHCTGQYFDYFQCIDKAVAPELFKLLK